MKRLFSFSPSYDEKNIVRPKWLKICSKITLYLIEGADYPMYLVECVGEENRDILFHRKNELFAWFDVLSDYFDEKTNRKLGKLLSRVS